MPRNERRSTPNRTERRSKGQSRVPSAGSPAIPAATKQASPSDGENAVRLAAELASSEARYRRLFEASKDGIVILDAQTGLITNVNPFLAKLLNYSRAELIGKALWDLGLFNDVEASKRAFRGLKAKRYARYDDLPLMTKGGQSISVEVVSSVYRVNGEKFIQCDIRDMRHRKDADLLDHRIRQAHKMEAVGQLAGGLAHDFNNLLGVILGYCEILEDQHELSKATRKMIIEIHNAGSSAKKLTQSLLAFSRRQVLEPVILDLNKTVNRIGRMLDRLIGEDIRLSSFLAPDLGRIRVDPSQVEQVLMNLAINARDAMPKGGVIVLKTANVEIDEEYARQNPSTEVGKWVILTVSDTGIGMDAETQTRIFEPFFSTKAPGQGTGLGLSTVFGIVKQSGGTISVHSEPGVGTTFNLYFPRCDDAPAHRARPKDKTLRGGKESILLVDDAGPLRELTRRLLEASGYSVLDSGDPAEALQKAVEFPGPLPLMITDVVMPGFSGPVLAERMASARPETKVLYMSGYNDDEVVPFRVIGQSYAFLNKPFTREELLRKVRELLDSSIHTKRKLAF
jgi:PAS domain S-box-containing protein